MKRRKSADGGRRNPSPGLGVLLVAVLALAAWAPEAAASDPASRVDPRTGSRNASGSIALELRWFPEPPASRAELDGLQPSLLLEPELRWRSADRRHHLDVAAFARLDGRDDERTHVDLREGSYRFVGDSFELLAGVSRVFWGVAESRHLVDLINQTDAVEDVDEEDRLGQPMLRLALDRDWGRLEAYSLIGFRERTFPGPEGRPRPPLPVAEEARYADDPGVDWALRWSHFVGAWDLGLHLFRGIGREPRLVASGDGRSLVPVYERIGQVGVDVQHTRGAWLWKLEALGREGQGSAFAAAVAGVEYTVYGVGGSAFDLGLLVEELWDGRDRTAPPTIFDQDTFLGARLAWNDVQGTRLLAGAVIDHDDGSVFGLVEGGRRLGDRVTLEVEARLFAGVDPAGDLAASKDDSFVTLRAAWHW